MSAELPSIFLFYLFCDSLSESFHDILTANQAKEQPGYAVLRQSGNRVEKQRGEAKKLKTCLSRRTVILRDGHSGTGWVRQLGSLMSREPMPQSFIRKSGLEESGAIIEPGCLELG